MLTVLIRYRVTRTETVQQVKTVEFYPNEKLGKRSDGYERPPAGLLLVYDDNESSHLSPTPEGDENWRDVFVMNAQGQTVARYTL